MRCHLPRCGGIINNFFLLLCTFWFFFIVSKYHPENMSVSINRGTTEPYCQTEGHRGAGWQAPRCPHGRDLRWHEEETPRAVPTTTWPRNRRENSESRPKAQPFHLFKCRWGTRMAEPDLTGYPIQRASGPTTEADLRRFPLLGSCSKMASYNKGFIF